MGSLFSTSLAHQLLPSFLLEQIFQARYHAKIHPLGFFTWWVDDAKEKTMLENK
ncbi:MAG: hypothetical protein Ct9H300mP28_15440 [Pseudomonadota bacterium]|nr:MAG: hypothetical protein Ct9H300mP28_15440 [Pseudomonadota bacterium]